MKVETNNITPTQSIPGSDKGTGVSTNNRILEDQSLVQGATVTSQPPAGASGAPEIPSPREAAQVGLPSFGNGQVVDMQQLLMWIANMAAEYIKQQTELNQTRQKAVESGFNASIEAANKNFDKNITQAIVGIVGASVSLAGSGFAAYTLGNVASDVGTLAAGATTGIEKATQVAQTANTIASGVSSAISSIGGVVSAGQELDAKKQEALSQLIAKTADSISNNEGSTRQIIDKFVNDLMATLKNFYASTTR
jgi:hypothetical protein